MRTDGSAVLDARERIEIDRSKPSERWRYRCPNGHVDWSRTNNHVWCKGCSRASRQNPAIDPEHYELIDAKTDEAIPWSAVEVVE
jgi:hypothetical protein